MYPTLIVIGMLSRPITPLVRDLVGQMLPGLVLRDYWISETLKTPWATFTTRLRHTFDRHNFDDVELWFKHSIKQINPVAHVDVLDGFELNPMGIHPSW
jgi:hypothetical protein